MIDLDVRHAGASSVGIERDVESVRGEWDDLADRTAATPFLRPSWIEAWWRAFGAGRFELVTVRREEELVAVVPLAVRGAVVRTASNWHTPVFAIIAKDSDAERVAAETAIGRAGRRLSAAFLEEGRTAQWEQAARAGGYRVISRTLERSPYIEITTDWETYERRLSGSFRGELRRRLRRLEEKGAVAFEIADGSKQLAELLEEGFAVEGSGWKDARGTAIASSPVTRRFYTDIATRAAATDSLRLAFLRLDSAAVAFQLNLEHRGVWYYLKGGFDPALARYSPGQLLMRYVLHHAFDAGLSRYEFLGGDERYKLSWTSTSSARVLMQAFAPTAAGLADYTVFAHGRPLAKRLGGDRIRRLVVS
jgi:CelD/BcsL family acetyltransferase involved in cellulose biosynthesis